MNAALALSLALALSPVAALAGDDLWSDDFALPEFDGGVTALVEFRGELIAAGNFLQAGGVPATRIARWNGVRWNPLGEGLPDMIPLALAVHEGRLYAGGADGGGPAEPSSVIFEWDGTSWSNVSFSLPHGSIECLTPWQGALIAAGGFGDHGTLSTSGVFRLEGTDWYPLGDPEPGRIQALLGAGDSLYIAGRFGGGSPTEPRPIVMVYDGGTWRTVARSGNPAQVTSVGMALALDGGDLVVGGLFTEIEGVPASCLAKRQGATWTGFAGSLDSEIGPKVTALRSTTTGLLVGGYFTSIGGTTTRSLARWTGNEWLGFGSELGWAGDALCEFQGRVVTGGWAGQNGSPKNVWDSVAMWDGSSWTPLAGEVESRAGVLGLASDDPVRVLEVLDGWLYLGGAFFFEGEPHAAPTRGVARWNGSGWTPLGPRAFDGSVHALAWYDDALFAAGRFTLPGGIRNIARWNGAAWEAVAGGIDGTVHALTVWGGDLYAAGDFLSAGGVACRSIARWNGRAWDAAGTDPSDAIAWVYALEPHEGTLVAGGYFARVGGVSVASVAGWDGRDWSPMGVISAYGLLGEVQALEVHDGTLYTGVETASGTGILRWNGLGWTTAAVTDGRVNRLLSAGGELFATGAFATLQFDRMNGIARWDGDVWSAMGQGLESGAGLRPHALAALGEGLWVGGRFTLAGGKSSFHLARWDGIAFTPPTSLEMAPARPNPFELRTSVRFTLPPGATGSAAVLDVGGRVIRTLGSHRSAGAPFDVTWNGRDDDGALAPAGVYFIRLRSNAGDRTARVAFVP